MVGNVIFLLIIYVAIAAVLVVISRKRKKEYHFDEMQEQIRAEGYKIAYMTTLFLLCGIIVVDSAIGSAIPEYILGGLLMAVVMISFLVWGIYCIVHNSFFMLGQNWNSYFSICLIVGAVNIISFASGILGWTKEEVHTQSLIEMILTKVSTSGVMAITFLTLAAVVGVKMLTEKNTGEE